MYTGLHAKYPLFLPDVNFFGKFSKKKTLKLHENMAGGSRPVPCGRTHMSKLTVAFLNFANAHKTAAKGKAVSIHVT
jgi:hypothetical protein